MKVLLKEYGSYSNLPLSVNSKILEVEELNMTEALRAKNKPIGHLPLSTEFKFIELDLKPLVSYRTYEHFEQQLKARENARKRRKAQEKRYNEKAKLIDEKKYEIYLKASLEVNMHRKTKLVPEWVANPAQEDQTWFTLDGKEIKAEKKASRPWEGKEETKEESKAEEVNNGSNSDHDNVWSGFEINTQKEKVEQYPALGKKPINAKTEKIPVIVSKVKAKQTKTKGKKTFKYKDDEGNYKELDLSDSESQYLATGDNDKYTLMNFITPANNSRRNKKKGRR
mmetsp:Transcript_25218/g.29073  ORF Transcript_25218/g.29073 Transcript_25218/m.29073 type:complete len:282 (-) Transcript_25218:37-882(-)